MKKDVSKKLEEDAAPHLEISRKEFDINHFDLAEAAASTALSIFPECCEAKEFIKIIRAIKDEDAIRILWGKYRETDDSADRLKILKELRDKDLDRKEKILDLIETETLEVRLKQEEQIVSEIAGYLEAKELEKAFDSLFPLLVENKCPNLIRDLATKHDQIQCVVNNKLVLGLDQDKARNCWLSFLQLRDISFEREPEKALALLKKSEKGFHCNTEYTAIRDECNVVITEQNRNKLREYFAQLESEKVGHDNANKLAAMIRRELINLPEEEAERYKNRLQKRLLKLHQNSSVLISRRKAQEYCNQIKDNNIDLDEAEKLLYALRKELSNLPKEEADAYESGCLRILDKLHQSNYAESFRKSLLRGDIESAKYLKQKINDTATILQIESEIASTFAVEMKPLEAVINANIYSALVIDKSKKCLVFIQCIDNEAFFKLSIDSSNYLVILNLNSTIARQYKMISCNYEIDRVIHSDPNKNEYHLLCKQNDGVYYYIKAILCGQDSRVMSHLNISDLLHIGNKARIDEVFYLTDDQRSLYVSYDYEDDGHHSLICVVDVYKGQVDLKKQSKCLSCAKLPTNPPRILLGEKQLVVCNSSLQKIRSIEIDKMWEFIYQISVNVEKKRVYLFIGKGKIGKDKDSLVILDFNLNIVECRDISSPPYLRSFRKYYDAARDFLFCDDCDDIIIYDCKKKTVIKNFFLSEFSEEDFTVQPLSSKLLYQSIKNDGYDICTDTQDGSMIDYLNGLLTVTDLYEKVHLIKPDLPLSEEILRLVEKTKDLRSKRFDDMGIIEQQDIKEFNRSLLDEIYPELTPKMRHLGSHCYYIRKQTNEYFIFAYSRHMNRLTVIDISTYIDRIVDMYR